MEQRRVKSDSDDNTVWHLDKILQSDANSETVFYSLTSVFLTTRSSITQSTFALFTFVSLQLNNC